MGLNCRVRVKAKDVVDAINKSTCTYRQTGKLCDPITGSFAEECTKCKKFQ